MFTQSDVIPFRGLNRILKTVIIINVIASTIADNSQETFANKMRVINEDLDRQLNEIMASEGRNYSTINTTGIPYAASTYFNPKGMGQLYNVTNMFIDLIQSKQAYPEGESFNSYFFFFFYVHLSVICGDVIVQEIHSLDG